MRYKPELYGDFRQILTNTGFKGGKYTENVSQKSFLSLFRPQKLFDFSLKISPCVTLVTAKNQHRCWKARTCARKTRMCVDLYVLGEEAISEKGQMINSH